MEARGLEIDLGGPAPVLHGVDLELRRGELLGLLGPNGAGKSTLARALAGLIPAARGTIRIEGADARTLGRREIARKVAWLPQDLPSGLPFTAAEVVLMGRRPHLSGALGLDGPIDRDAAAAALAKVDAAHLASRPLDALSGGERRRILLAKLLAQAAPIWILDEPTAHLDLAHQHSTLALARAHADAGGSVLCVLHDLTHAAQACDRVAVLSAGRIVAVGPPAEVLQPALLTGIFHVPFVTIRHPETGEATVVPDPRLRAR
ncbi:Heme ABC transporter, ATPase component HmuV [Vulgatibacter incomptus]|uniref:Heme ABC transporter, ATPase component HmuV n=1 Tax=Vulgatibacter incomptus TaxID=1391653 RepID=A0A0K1PGR3_9BACT|nr:Heme ABC transporter, ATPase component HmuV [Vulgatibacter incomptus]